jgi:hypothetical protein
LFARFLLAMVNASALLAHKTWYARLAGELHSTYISIFEATFWHTSAWPVFVSLPPVQHSESAAS